MKILRAKEYPKDIGLCVRAFRVDELRFLPSDKWLSDRMERFGYDESFRVAGMLFPIAVSTHNHKWVRRRIEVEPNNPENTNLDKCMYMSVTSGFSGQERMGLMQLRDT